MNTKELLKKVRKIEIKTRRLSDHIFGGEYHSTFKGRGMTFSEVRQYQIGDDVRTIDWNVTARMNQPFIKEYIEERELNVMLMVDVSSSGEFGSTKKLSHKYDPNLIGGLVIKVGSTMIDNSIKNKLQQIEKKMIEA